MLYHLDSFFVRKTALCITGSVPDKEHDFRFDLACAGNSADIRVGKQSNIGEVDAMKEDFEKTATQKIRRFKYKSFKPENNKPSDNPKSGE